MDLKGRKWQKTGEDCKTSGLRPVLSDDLIKEHVVEMEEEKSGMAMGKVQGKTFTLHRMGGYGLDLAGSGNGHMASSCVYGNELRGLLECGEFGELLLAI